LSGLVSGIRFLGFRLLRLRRDLDGGGGGTDAELPLTDHGVEPRDVALDRTDAAVALELAGGRLEAQVEQLFLGLAQLLDEALVFERVELARGELLGADRHYASPSSRLMMRAFNGSLWMARVSASRASSSLTPATSNRTRPGLTFATHHSGEPLPEPMRVSAGFLVSGRSGQMLIHTLPPRLMCRLIAIRADSICRLVMYACSSAWMPYSPKLTDVPPLAMPRCLGWCCLRCLTLRGINMIQLSVLSVVGASTTASGAASATGSGAAVASSAPDAARPASVLVAVVPDAPLRRGRVPDGRSRRGRSAPDGTVAVASRLPPTMSPL